MNQRDYGLKMKYYDIIGSLFVASLLISNIAAQKLFNFFGITFTAGIIFFPVTYIFGDVLTEVYGYRATRRVVWTGFAAQALMVIVLGIAVALPPAEGWPLQEQFASVLGLVPRIVLASLCGYLAGEFTNSYVLAQMKIRSNGRNLWMRTIGSTLAGQAVDTALFVIIAFTAVFPPSVLVSTAVSAYVFKVAYEILATPLTYLVVGYLKRTEGVDTFDHQTNFNPFISG